MTTASSRPALRLAATSEIDLAAAIDAFLSQPDLAATTRAKYRQRSPSSRTSSATRR